MEDSHIADTNLPGGVCVFGVFDGHGGAEVALYTKEHFINFLISSKAFQQKEYEKALEETFFKIDTEMQTQEGKKFLNNLANQGHESLVS